MVEDKLLQNCPS